LLRRILAALTDTRATVPLAFPSGSSVVRSASPAPITRDGRAVRVRGWEQHPVVQACARTITDLASTVPFRAMGRPDPAGNRQPLPDNHPLAQLLRMPAPRTTPRTVRAQIALDLIIYGNAFQRLDRTTPTLALRRVNPEGVQQVYVDSDGDPARYVWSDYNGAINTTEAADVLHFRDLALSPASIPDVYGFPRAASALTAMASDLEASAYVRQVVGNDGAPPFVVMMHEQATAADAIAMQERYIERQVNRGRRGVPEFMGGVKDVKALGFTLADLEFPDLRRISREDICAAFGVDPRMIGVGSAASDAGMSGTQYIEARARLIAHTIEPLLGLIEDELTTWLAAEYGDVAIEYDRDVLRELSEDDKATSERVRAEFAASLRSWDEARAALRLPPDVDPLAYFQSPAMSVFLPAGMLFADPREREAVDATPEPEPPAPEPESEDEPEIEDEDAPEQNRRARPGLTRAQRAEMWSAFDARATAQEEPYRLAALQRFAFERRDVAARLAGAVRAGPKDKFVRAALKRIREDYKPGGKYHEQWLAEYRALIGETYRIGAGSAMSSYGLSFDLRSPQVEAAIEARADRLATLVGRTTGDDITAAVLAGEQAGLGAREIARLIDATVFGGMAENRAMIIARTETVGALNQGEFAAATESGLLESKSWLSQGDDRVREDHAMMDGETIGINDDFPIGLRYPGDPMGDAAQVINCRCTLTYSDLPAPR
jgi:HK97 family phage portal protein